jgi:MoaA/NifB/PqqE/SkfB family radical SAM enzyme
MTNKSERIILHDSKFGKLSYHKQFKQKFEFPGEKLLCHMPFTYAEVRRHGTVNICCPQWNPAEIGNVLTEDLQDIWLGEKAKTIRNTILDGSYSYCNSETCPNIQNWKTGGLWENTESNQTELFQSIQQTPSHVHLVIDHSCNLECPSCRTDKITQLDRENKDSGLLVARKVFNSMFKEPHDDHKVLGMDGSGEIFSSELYRELFETEKIFTHTDLWPNLKFNLSTNGTMMTEKIQNKYKVFFEHIKKIEISIDAGNEVSYNKVRVGGHWDLLWKNLHYLYSTIKDKPDVEWQWNLIVQTNNFESIPEFLSLANQFTEKRPTLNFSKVLNWGTWTDEEYMVQAVHLPSHPGYDRYLEILNATGLNYLK